MFQYRLWTKELFCYMMVSVQCAETSEILKEITALWHESHNLGIYFLIDMLNLASASAIRLPKLPYPPSINTILFMRINYQMVRLKRLELSTPLRDNDLNVACLPIPPQSQTRVI
jgi:hypothetical protein